MGKLSRTKGHAWEREFARRLRDIGIDAERTLTEVRDGNVGDIQTNLPITFQCKVGARPDIYGAVREAVEAAAPPANYAVAIIKRNQSSGHGPEELAVLPLVDFLEIIDALKSGGVW